MGYKSAIRSFGATVKRIERESIRQQKELEKRRKQYEKMQELEKAQYEVEVYENTIARMTTLHKDCSSKINWELVLKAEEPPKPIRINDQEKNARIVFNSYHPSFFDKLFGRVEKKKKLLEDKINIAIRNETDNFQTEINEYNQNLNEYNDDHEIAKMVIDKNVEGYKRAIEKMNVFSEISGIGSSLTFTFISDSKIKVELYIHDGTAIPRQTKSLLKSGKISVKDMPIGKYNELYQDYVCSAALRVARELFSLLPVEEVLLNAVGTLLNQVNGKMENQIILSVLFVGNTMESLNYELIDPSDSMQNFKHNMGFKKNAGMQIVEEIS